MDLVRANDHITGLDDTNVSSLPLITTPRSHTCIYVPLDAVCNSPTSTTGSASILEYNSNSDGDMESYLQADPSKSNFPSMPTSITGMFPIPISAPDSLSSSTSSMGSSFPSSSRHAARVLGVNCCAVVHESDTVGFDTNIPGSCIPSLPAKTLPDQCRTNADVPCLTYPVHAEKSSTILNNFVNEWKAVVEGEANERSQFQEPSAVNTRSRSTSPGSELLVSRVEQSVDSRSRGSTPDSTDGLAELTASMMTVRPRSPSVLTSRGGESLIQIPGPNSRSSSSLSDHDFTFEVRPPSTTRVTQDVGTASMAQPEGLHPFFTPPIIFRTLSPGLRVSSSSGSIMPGSCPMSESVTGKLTPPCRLHPVPPIPSVRFRTTQRLVDVGPAIPCQITSTSRFASSLPVNATTKDSFPRNSSTINSETYCTGHSRTSRTRRPVQVVEDTSNSDSERSSTLTDITTQNDEFVCIPSLSPLTWDAVPPYRTLRSSPPTIPHLTTPWTQTTHPSDVRHFNPSTPEIIEPSTRTPSERMNRRYTHSARVLTRPSTPAFDITPASYTDSPAAPPPSRASPPSGPQRRTRFAPTLPSSPGSSLRTSAFNSPYDVNYIGPTSSGSWGTQSTTLDPVSAPPMSTTSRPVSRSTSMGSRGTVPSWPSETNESHPWSNPHSNLSDVDLLRPPGLHSGYSAPQLTQSPTFSRFLLICGTCGCPPITCDCGRHARVSATTPSRIRTPTRQGSTPHPMFWFADGTVVLEVEDTLFRVHKYFFERNSDHFKNMFGRNSSSPAHIHRISDTKRQDFERLLKVFYPSSFTNSDLITVEEWTSVLTVAVRWHMDEVISLAIQKLTPITPAVDKIALAKKFGLFVAPNSNYNRDWLLPALQELCTRNLPLRLEEAKKLDMWTVIKVWEVQHELELSHSGVAQNVSDVEHLIKRRFRLE